MHANGFKRMSSALCQAVTASVRTNEDGIMRDIFTDRFTSNVGGPVIRICCKLWDFQGVGRNHSFLVS